MTTTVKQVLQKARQIISLPEHWTQGTSCRNKSGDQVGYSSGEAYSYCMGGAVDVAVLELCGHVGDDPNGAVLDLLSRVTKRKSDLRYIPFNDRSGRTHPEVLEVLDAAIAAAE